MKLQGMIRRYLIFAAVICVVLLISGVKSYWDEELAGTFAPDCMIEYGSGACTDGVLSVPFYNPNSRDITSIDITVPLGAETNITLPATFSVHAPLGAGRSGILNLVPCNGGIDMSGFSIEWCCGSDCYRGRLNRPTGEINVETATGNPPPANESSAGSYPQHPESLNDCAGAAKRDFCIGDVAEMHNDTSICRQIQDPDIRTFCVSRISLNETMCGEVVDEGLRNACLESIGMKKGGR